MNSNANRLLRMQQLSSGIMQSLLTQDSSEDMAKQLRATFPHAAYVSVTSVMGRGNAVELVEHLNLAQAGPLTRDAYFATCPSVAVEAISCNQNKYYDESVHKQKLANARDFQRAASELDCASIVCVPLPCHSRLVPANVQATVHVGGAVHCAHCHKRLEAAARPLGCITLAVKRKVNFSIREYLAKTLVLAGFVGPRLLRPSHTAAQQQQQQMAQQQQQQTGERVGLALQSSWYNAPPTVSSGGSLPPMMPGAVGGLGDTMRRMSLSEAEALYGGGRAGRMSIEADLFSRVGRMSLDARMSLDGRLSNEGRLSNDGAGTSMDSYSAPFGGLPAQVQAVLSASQPLDAAYGLPPMSAALPPQHYQPHDGRLSLDSQSSSISSMHFGEYLRNANNGASRPTSIDLGPFPGMSSGLSSAMTFGASPFGGGNGAGYGGGPGPSSLQQQQADCNAHLNGDLAALMQASPDSVQLMMALYNMQQQQAAANAASAAAATLQ